MALFAWVKRWTKGTCLIQDTLSYLEVNATPETLHISYPIPRKIKHVSSIVAWMQPRALKQLLISESDREGPKGIRVKLFFEFFGPKRISKAEFIPAIVYCYSYR